MSVCPTHADLSAIVSPGYTWRAGERADTSKLNRTANPTITITGTVGGTNANIAAGSINGTMLVTGFPGSNLTWDASSPRKLVITNDGVNVLQIHSAIAGNGLTGGSGSALSVNVDTNTITVTNDTITLNLTTFSNLVAIISTNIAQYYQTNTFANYAWAKFFGTNATTTYNPIVNNNVSNIVRTASGYYTVNFTNAMRSTNFSVVATLGGDLANQGGKTEYFVGVGTQTVNSVSLRIFRGTGSTDEDPAFVHLQVNQ